MISRAQRSPTGWLLLFIGFGIAGGALGLVVSWAADWPVTLALFIGVALGLLVASRAVARPASSDLAAVDASIDLSPVHTSRLSLRRFTDVDATTGALAGTIDEVVATSMGWGPDDVDSLVSMGDRPALLRAQGFLAIAQLEGDRVVGVVSLTRTPGSRTDGRLGIWLGPGQRGHGFGAEAVRMATQLAWGIGLRTLTMGTTAANEAMNRCFVSAGAQLVETTPHELPDGRVEESRWYRIDRPEDDPSA